MFTAILSFGIKGGPRVWSALVSIRGGGGGGGGHRVLLHPHARACGAIYARVWGGPPKSKYFPMPALRKESIVKLYLARLSYSAIDAW